MNIRFMMPQTSKRRIAARNAINIIIPPFGEIIKNRRKSWHFYNKIAEIARAIPFHAGNILGPISLTCLMGQLGQLRQLGKRLAITLSQMSWISQMSQKSSGNQES